MATKNEIAQIRQDLASALTEEEAILDSQARTGHHYDTDGVADMVGERVAWLRERLAAAEAAEVEAPTAAT
jgi:ubiquinone biosynthesis protein UbiJ